jgi:hypothetical protein
MGQGELISRGSAVLTDLSRKKASRWIASATIVVVWTATASTAHAQGAARTFATVNEINRILESKPAEVLLSYVKTASGAAVPGSAAITVLKGGSDTADLLQAYQKGGVEAEWEKAGEKAFIKASTQFGGAFGPVGAVSAAVVAKGSYDIGKYLIAPVVAPWLADRWIEADRKYGLTAFGRSLREAERQARTAEEQLRASKQAHIARSEPAANPAAGIRTSEPGPASAAKTAPAKVDTAKTQTTPALPGPTRQDSSPSAASAKSDDYLRAVMNNPRESPEARAIAAIALGKDPSVFLAKSRNGAGSPAGQSDRTASGQEGQSAAQKIAAIALAQSPSPTPTPGNRAGNADKTDRSASRSGQSDNRVAARDPQPAVAAARSVVASQLAPASGGVRYQTPGGISLSKAAAERMPLDITLEGAVFREGKLVLAGRTDSSQTMNAALLMTALRTACEPGDPYFSLDPDDGADWNRLGETAFARIWPAIRDDAGWHSKPVLGRNPKRQGELSFRTYSARRDYPKLWASVTQELPDFRTKLVFKPAWIRQTRFGEILYKADVLLKELSSGVSLLGARELRAKSVQGYAAVVDRRAGSGLLKQLEAKDYKVAGGWQGHRMWFDLVPQESGPAYLIAPMPFVVAAQSRPERASHELTQLRKILGARGLLAQTEGDPPVSPLQKDGASIDVSSVYPRMFIRLHDLARNRDMEGVSQETDELLRHVNRRMPQYGIAYPELRSLIELFRAYVIAVHVTRLNPQICARIGEVPLLDSEKLASPLPDYHPSELFVAVASYEFPVARGRRKLAASSSSVSGGVSIGGRDFYSRFTTSGTSPIIQALSVEAGDARAAPAALEPASGLRFVALSIESLQESPQRVAGIPPAAGGGNNRPAPSVAVNIPPDNGLARDARRPPGSAGAQQLARQGELPASAGDRNNQPAPPAVDNILVDSGLARDARKSPASTGPQLARQGEWPATSNNRPAAARDAETGMAALQFAAILGSIVVVYLLFIRPMFSSRQTVAAGAQQPQRNVPDNKGRYPSGAWAMPDQSKIQSDYDAVEKEFNNVFAMQGRVDKERMITASRRTHGGTRAETMRRLIDQWRRDNRS